MKQYTRNVQTVTAFQTPWPMQITCNGKTISGLAGQWLIIPPNGSDPYFLDDIVFEQQFSEAAEQ